MNQRIKAIHDFGPRVGAYVPANGTNIRDVFDRARKAQTVAAELPQIGSGIALEWDFERQQWSA